MYFFFFSWLCHPEFYSIIQIMKLEWNYFLSGRSYSFSEVLNGVGKVGRNRGWSLRVEEVQLRKCGWVFMVRLWSHKTVETGVWTVWNRRRGVRYLDSIVLRDLTLSGGQSNKNESQVQRELNTLEWMCLVSISMT